MLKVPFVTREKVEEIAEYVPTPFYLYDEQGIRDTAHAVNQAFGWNHHYREYFAVKACPNPKILKILQEYGCGCDCSSLSELFLAHACGFHGDQIMFSSNNTPDEEYLLARELGATINLDDITHIDQLIRLFNRPFPDTNMIELLDDPTFDRNAHHIYFPKTMSCRYNPGGTFKVNNEIMGDPSEAKYGMTTEQIFEAFATLKRLGVKHFGLHAFLASNTLGEEYYAENARILCELAVRLHQELNCHIAFINLSGGIGIPYRPDQEPNDIQSIGQKVETVWKETIVKHGLKYVALYTEMGRFMTGPHGCLVTKTIHRKNIHKSYIGVDACAADLMRPAMYGAYHHITILGKEDQPDTEVYDIVGSLCENNDKFAIDRPLPHIDIGDYLVIHDTGAHGRAMSYNYNGKLRCGEILLHPDEDFSIIRHKETIRELFSTIDSCEEIQTLFSPDWGALHPKLRDLLYRNYPHR